MCNKADKKRGKRYVELLECDGCLRGYHLDCLDPPLDIVPEVLSYWDRTLCKGAGFLLLHPRVVQMKYLCISSPLTPPFVSCHVAKTACLAEIAKAYLHEPGASLLYKEC